MAGKTKGAPVASASGDEIVIGKAVGNIAETLSEALAQLDDYSGTRLLRMVRGMARAELQFLDDVESD